MTTEIRLPPLLTLHAVAAGEDAFHAARSGAAQHRLGAGDVVLAAGEGQDASLAIVLEPEVPSAAARQMLPLAAVALADALGMLLPPKVSVEHRWPGTLLINGAPGAELRLAMAEAHGDALPDWLVIGVRVHMTLPQAELVPGALPDHTALIEEGGEEITKAALVQSLATQFLNWLDVWQSRGFATVSREWLFRASGRLSPTAITTRAGPVTGKVVGLAADASLVVALAEGGETRISLDDVAPLA